MIRFCKGSACPTSQSIFELSHHKSGSTIVSEIQDHLAECDFCAAEFQLYVNVSDLEETEQVAEIPKHLFDLAEVLLGNKHKEPGILDNLLENGNRFKESPA